MNHLLTRRLILSLLLLSCAQTQAEEKITRVHWVGSAWMNYHGLAPQCSEWLAMQPGFGKVEHSTDKLWPLHALLDDPPSKMQLYGDPRTQAQIVADIRARDFDVLVLAMHLEMVAKDSTADAFARTLGFFASEAKRCDARLIFAAYGTTFGDDCARGMGRLRTLAHTHHAIICPWWSAMKSVSTQRPDADLLGKPTKGHPSIGSIYLNLCTFICTLTNTAPDQRKLPKQFRGWDTDEPPHSLSTEDAMFFQQTAWAAWNEARDARQPE